MGSSGREHLHPELPIRHAFEVRLAVVVRFQFEPAASLLAFGVHGMQHDGRVPHGLAAVVLQNDKAQRSRGLARPSPDHARKKNARNEDRRRSNPKESIHRVAILSKTAETCHSRAEGKPSIIRKSALHPRLDKA